MYDIIYIGGGLNYAGAIIAAKEGLKVALIQTSLDQLGGTCLHKGCTPSKMFLHYAQTVLQSKESIFDGDISLNMQTLIENKTKLISNSLKSITAQCKQIELIEGEGHIIAAHKVAVGDTIYEGKYIIIGTGSSAFIPEGIAYDGTNIITSNEVLELTKLPKSISIYGDGAIGLEMASFFASAKVEVTLISRKENILPHSHPLIQSAMSKQLKNLGIKHLQNHPILKAKSTSRGVHITFEDKQSIYSEYLLVATGRHPNTDVISTDEISIKNGIYTDAFFETTLSKHYAIGDCNGKLQLAHAARAQVINVTMRILGKEPKILDLNHVVKFIHTLPMSYATIGQNKKMLEELNITFKESVVSLAYYPNADFHNSSDGSIIVYADEEGFILGAEILAPDAEELIAPIAMALAGEMDVSLARNTVMAHPTFSEALERAYFRL